MENQKEQKLQTKNSYAVPIAIVIAGAFIALAVFFSGGRGANTAVAPSVDDQQVDTTNKLRPVDKSDHTKGATNPKVTIVEYSDFECPFCKRHHGTMNEIIKEEKDVAWVYRHFPLDSLHPRNARKVAVASECVNKLGGNNAFWKFTDGYFRDTLSNDRTIYDKVVPPLVAEAGVNKSDFDKCVSSGEMDKHVQADIDNAIATGGRGTPWGVVITASGKTLPLNGSQPKEAIKQLLDFARNN